MTLAWDCRAVRAVLLVSAFSLFVPLAPLLSLESIRPVAVAAVQVDADEVPPPGVVRSHVLSLLPAAAPQISLRRTIAGRVGRLAVYGALFIAIGAIGIGVIAVPRLRRAGLDEDNAFATMLDGMALTVGVVAGFLLAMAALLRTILQWTDSNEMDPSLTITRFLSATALGRTLGFSTIAGALVAISAAMARRHRGSSVWRVLEVSAVVLFLFVWAGSGHSVASTTFFGIRADFPLVIHVLAAGLWIGSLAVIFVTVLPLALGDPARLPLLRATVWSFAGMALVSAGVLVVTGLLNAMAQLGSLSDVVSSPYGRTLLAKLAVVAILMVLGAYNWRVVRLRLHDIAGALRLRSMIRLELLLAAIVLVITSVLVATVPTR